MLERRMEKARRLVRAAHTAHHQQARHQRIEVSFGSQAAQQGFVRRFQGPAHGLMFVVLFGFVENDAAILLGHVDQALIAVIPIGR